MNLSGNQTLGLPHQRTCVSPSPDSVCPLLCPSVPEALSAPSAPFDLTFDLGIAAVCADFRENIDFQFSLGWTALVSRFLGNANAKRALSGAETRTQVGNITPLFVYLCLSFI